ncbi:DUF4136 domain-containing protein [uncultured Mucilaginibacter sp.]|uniref:DUF4136 domain-containing protein n=1 Tax=uncultured Mucilaginibacter sp. TaxID=797541 RepID=UPI0025FA1622|nr:DUF4136 domain-containing protein [uncultured Mucilaginibacter sp.]
MKKILTIALAFSIIALISACSSYNYYSVGGNEAALSRYSSFAWLPPIKQTRNVAYNNELADQRIHESATEQLESRGLRLKSKNPDLLVRYSIMVDTKERVYDQPVYNYVGGGYYPRAALYRGRLAYYYAYSAPYPVYVGNDVERIPYKEGTLIIDLINRKSRKVIWRGYGVGEVENAARTIEDIPKIVEGIIKKLPLNKVK